MKRVRMLIVLLIAIGAGAGLAFGTYSYLQNMPVKTVSAPTRPVVVADTDLSLGAELQLTDLRVIDWPESAAPGGGFEDPDDVIGRGVISSIVRFEPILEAKLAPRELGAGLPPVIPNGLRAVSVRVNEVIGVAGYVLPGTRVDVLATVNPGIRNTQRLVDRMAQMGVADERVQVLLNRMSNRSSRRASTFG